MSAERVVEIPAYEDVGLTNRRATRTFVKDNITISSTATEFYYDMRRYRHTIFDVANASTANTVQLDIWGTLRELNDGPPPFGLDNYAPVHSMQIPTSSHDVQTLSDNYAFLLFRLVSSAGATGSVVVRAGE